jgi:hypothetical protein
MLASSATFAAENAAKPDPKGPLSYSPPPGQIGDVPKTAGNTLAGINPNPDWSASYYKDEQGAPTMGWLQIYAYGGSRYIENLGPHGSMITLNSGHSIGNFNFGARFDLASKQWSLVGSPERSGRNNEFIDGYGFWSGDPKRTALGHTYQFVWPLPESAGGKADGSDVILLKLGAVMVSRVGMNYWVRKYNLLTGECTLIGGPPADAAIDQNSHEHACCFDGKHTYWMTSRGGSCLSSLDTLGKPSIETPYGKCIPRTTYAVAGGANYNNLHTGCYVPELNMMLALHAPPAWSENGGPHTALPSKLLGIVLTPDGIQKGGWKELITFTKQYNGNANCINNGSALTYVKRFNRVAIMQCTYYQNYVLWIDVPKTADGPWKIDEQEMLGGSKPALTFSPDGGPPPAQVYYIDWSEKHLGFMYQHGESIQIWRPKAAVKP